MQFTVPILVHGLIDINNDTVVCEIRQIISPNQPGILIRITKENTGAPPSQLPPVMQITKHQCLLATVILLPATRTQVPIKGHIIKAHEPSVGVHALA